MQNRAQKWLDKVIARRLHRQMMWFSLDRQMRPSVGYGLCCSTAKFHDLEEFLIKQYSNISLIGGIICTAARGLRLVDQGFYRCGFPHPRVKATVEQSNKLLMHNGCCTALGYKLQTLMELMISKLDLSFQPFLLSYEEYGEWMMDSWLKCVWEKVDRFRFQVSMHNIL
jgi:hypothetical protein